MKISAVLITKNEESNIADAIESVRWADEVLIVDSESADRTAEIAREMGCRVIVRPWPGFSQQKQFAADSAENDWVLSVDADERVSTELRDEILSLRRRPNLPAGFRIRRLSYYMGRPIRHSGWYPDLQLRLFDRRHGRWNTRLVHESVSMDNGSRVENLEGELLHYSVRSASEHHRMIGERYAPLAARQMFENGRVTSPARIAAAGPAAFLRTYLLKLGFLDGLPGLAIASFAAHHAFLKHMLLWEMHSRDDGNSHLP